MNFLMAYGAVLKDWRTQIVECRGHDTRNFRRNRGEIRVTLQAYEANIGAYQPIVWVAALGALALAPRENVRREWFLLTIVGLQLAFYLAAYAVTPLDVVGHVNGSWDRISSHVTMLVAFAGVTSAGAALNR